MHEVRIIMNIHDKYLACDTKHCNMRCTKAKMKSLSSMKLKTILYTLKTVYVILKEKHT
jgi:hypothetical protein